MATATAAKTYEYSYRDKKGKLVKGKLEAPSEEVLIQRLRQQGFAPLDVKQANTGLSMEIKLPGSNKVDLKDLAIMSRQFATMIDSGLSLLKSLSILAEQTESAPLAKVLNEVRHDVEGGGALSTAMAKHTKVFPPLMINMCRAGEVGGFLDKVLLQIAENMEAEVKLRAKIKSAMTYPVVVFIMAIIAVVGMLLFIVPVFSNMFATLGGELPAPTKALVFLSSAMKIIAPVAIVLAIPGGVLWGKYRNTEAVRGVVDPMKLKVPIFGDLFRKVAISRFSRNLGTMLTAGVPILRSLEIVGEAAGNVVLRDAAKAVEESVRQGKTLAGPLSEHKVFPPMVVQMLSVGEDTGAMDNMLHKIADFYDQEVEATTEALTSIIEPLMIAVLGSVIGAMIVALYMPIFSVFELIE
ncbi:type II secretion system F family protein [Kineosporia rhizophila]|uniref:type II secretion system F family protein n=1 Tax=Kineosporia TaxID=49184 RepID=UPI001E51E895|nr:MULTISPECIES: type II secretion system F family protein [Kineosporia]MCE0539955.1 type II secretion system F family protein [Kineosporia rhizophila]GLY17330.1 type II secretion system protein F [Kineosporia sp. NBRC 101677]